MPAINAICFSGHRPSGLPAPGSVQMEKLKSLLREAVRSAILEGATSFYAGGAQGFDMLAEETVLSLKAEFPAIRLVLALPAPDQAVRFSAADRSRYHAIIAAADEIHYSESTCSTRAMHARDRYLTEHADKCICFMAKLSGGTYYTVSHALKRGIPVENLALRLNGD